MIVVCDANILVRAAWSLSGPAAEVIHRMASFPHQLICSHVLLSEVERILKHPRLQQRHGLDAATIERFSRQLEIISARVVVPVHLPPVVIGDPLDDHVIYAACASQAEVICTRDKHLFHPTVLDYCAQHRIRVLTDLDLLAELLLH